MYLIIEKFRLVKRAKSYRLLYDPSHYRLVQSET